MPPHNLIDFVVLRAFNVPKNTLPAPVYGNLLVNREATLVLVDVNGQLVYEGRDPAVAQEIFQHFQALSLAQNSS